MKTIDITGKTTKKITKENKTIPKEIILNNLSERTWNKKYSILRVNNTEEKLIKFKYS